MHRGLVALSASAVAAIYMAGYLRTQAADASIGAADVLPSPAAVATAPPAPSATAPVVVQRPSTQARTAPTPQPTTTRAPAGNSIVQNAAPYKDGTYTGQGSSRRGDVWVSVQVQGGRIANVTITRSSLQYPLRDIANLPQEVVQRQSAQVDNVSRATYSSMAFKGAVTQALAAARAA
jgi:uncharacterized protein with FMN-binding domain